MTGPVDLPIKTLIGLCGLVSFPGNYHLDTVFPDARDIQEANQWLIESDKLGKEGIFDVVLHRTCLCDQVIDPYIDLPENLMYFTQASELDGLAIAGPLLKFAEDGGISVPKMSRDGSMRIEEDCEDYMFLNHGSPKGWSWPARRLSDEVWHQLVRAGPRPDN